MQLSLGSVRAFHAGPTRRYHTIRHVRAVVACLCRWARERGETALPPSLLAAALFHDAVYDPKRTDNEERSADLCLATLGETPDARRAVSLILSTKTHVPADDSADARALLDADLFILGATPRVYDRYADAIRAEFAHVPDTAYRTGRIAVLEHFLRRTSIYHGGWRGDTARERQGRANLEREIERLCGVSRVDPAW